MYIKNTVYQFLTVGLLTVSIIVFPGRAHASILGTISKFITQVTGADEEIIQNKNMQTIDLLTPGVAAAATSAIPEVNKQTGLLSVSAGPLRISTEDEVYIPEEDTISVYVVKKTDTLNSIAKLYNVSVNTIVWANNLSDRKVTEGQVLTILPVSGIQHIIKNGDTLKNIATKYGADVDDIAVFNGVTAETNLVIGDTLLIPDGEITDIPKPKEEKDSKKTTKKETKTKKTIKTIIKNLTQVDGYFIRPIRGGVRTTGLHGHNAVDLANAVGTPIMASADGRVIVVKTGGYNGGYGNYVVVSHPNGTQTLYAHTSENLVSVGESVEQGQVIAKVGSTGKSTGPHVHFEVRGARNPF